MYFSFYFLFPSGGNRHPQARKPFTYTHLQCNIKEGCRAVERYASSHGGLGGRKSLSVWVGQGRLLKEGGMLPNFKSKQADNKGTRAKAFKCQRTWYLWVRFGWISETGVRLVQFTQSCLTLCDPMDCSTPGLPVHHQLPELAQTHVHRVGDAIQPSHPLLSPSPPAFNLSQYQGLFQ